jgi:hypothetical protein
MLMPIATSVTMTSEAWDIQTPLDTEVSDDADGIDELEEQPVNRPSTIDILSWYDNIIFDSTAEPLPLTPTPFKSGIISGQSVNDTLMIKDLIDTRTYMQFFDLSSFSRR